MKIRIECTAQEIDKAVELLRLTFHVLSISKPYKNRNSNLYRIYVEAEKGED